MNMRKNHVLACVTGQRNCERLIRHSASLARTLECPVSVIHVAGGKAPFMGSGDESEALEYLYQISKEHAAEMTVVRAENIADTIARHARKRQITHVVIGGPAATGKWDFPALLKKRLPGVQLYIIPSDARMALVSDGVSASVPCFDG